MLIIESDDKIANEPVSRKKIKKLTREESIAAEMDKWTS